MKLSALKPSARVIDPATLSNESLAYAISTVHDELYSERAEAYRSEAAKRLRALAAATLEKPDFHRQMGITLLDAKYLDPACHKGCQSLVHQSKLTELEREFEQCKKERSEWAGANHRQIGVIQSQRARIAELERENRELKEDKARLDWLEKNRQRLNAHCGSDYGWKVIQSHLVNRLMLEPSGVCSMASVDVNDCEGTKHDVRAAIDAARNGGAT